MKIVVCCGKSCVKGGYLSDWPILFVYKDIIKTRNEIQSGNIVLLVLNLDKSEKSFDLKLHHTDYSSPRKRFLNSKPYN